MQDVFKRVEKKYMLSRDQYEGLNLTLANRMQQDCYGKHTICNIYFDTEDDRMIRASLEKPIYKEKLRLRSYGIPWAGSTVFAEIKKKYKGVVYKRREALTLEEARLWLYEDGPCPRQSQISRELARMLEFYRPRPRVFIGYDRIALFGRQAPELRLTFDTNIRWRSQELDLEKGDWGRPLTGPEEYLMEIKIPGSMPLWLCRALEEQRIRQVSYSKYGTCYQRYLCQDHQKDKRLTA